MTATVEQEGQDVGRKHYLADVGSMASRVVHEIRNPLNAIRMQVAVIRNKLAHPDPANLAVAAEQLELLEQEVLRLEELAQAFLEFGRPPAEEPEMIDVAALVEETAALVRPRFEHGGMTVTTDPGTADPPLMVMMDRRRLRQVLHNLIDNAGLAMEAGGRLSIQVSPGRDGQVMLQVRDTGRGIPPEVQSRIFTPFYSEGEGSGLGLPIVKRIIEDANGEIEVQSEVGKGTRVKITLPAAGPGLQA